jgi:hypothetical protein
LRKANIRNGDEFFETLDAAQKAKFSFDTTDHLASVSDTKWRPCQGLHRLERDTQVIISVLEMINSVVKMIISVTPRRIGSNRDSDRQTRIRLRRRCFGGVVTRPTWFSNYGGVALPKQRKTLGFCTAERGVFPPHFWRTRHFRSVEHDKTQPSGSGLQGRTAEMDDRGLRR